MKRNESGKQQFLLFIYLLTLPLCADCNEVRLWPSRCSGRVEVFHSGRWGTVCDDEWKKANSDVLCRELGCGHVISTRHGADPGQGSIWLDDVRCNGNESSILSCDHRSFGSNNCDHSEDAGVMCSDGVRLSNGTNRCSGALEVFRDGAWAVVCSTNWGQTLSKAVCKQLECGPPKKMDTTSRQNMGYIGSCAENQTSFSECTVTKSSEMCNGVVLSCEGIQEIRLMNGTDRCSGRVEVFYENRWGTVCDDDWDMKDATVVCQAMDCGAPLEATNSASFGQGSGEIWLDNVECAGNESGLMQCAHNALGDNNCGHTEDAGVVCSSQIRLINGTSGCSGRVEFSRNDQWSSARRSSWGKKEATVVCRQMNCGEAVSFSGSNSANEPRKMFDVNCTGGESSLTKCAFKEFNRTSGDKSEDATVACTGNVILSEGPNRCAGRVEFFHKGQWADICSDSWDMNDAAVVCQQLKCGTAHKILTSMGRPGTSVWVNQTHCNGREMSLSLCRMNFSNQTCNSPTVAGVICSEGLVVRLGNGPDRCSGRVEVRRGDEWGTVCDSSVNLIKAKILCDLLECGHAVNVSNGGAYPPGVGSVYDASDSCFTSVNSIHQCSAKGFKASSCGHNRDAGIVCGGDSSIRLVNGTDRCSGRVEILYSAQWGTVCDDDWDIRDAQVVCSSKDCGSAIAAIPGAFFGQGVGNIWLDDVNCVGNESSLVNCRRTSYGGSNCGHGEDAGVICSAHLRLLGGQNQCSGNVEVYYDGEWLSAVSLNWGRNEAAVVCKEMNCGDPMTVSGSIPPSSELQRGFKVKCTGRESSISQCTVISYTGADTERLRRATVTCSGIVKLVDGPNRCIGRAEIFHEGQWGNVCAESWDLNDAKVVCQQLNCGDAFKITSEPDYGHGKGIYLVEHIECNGRESILQQCDVRHGKGNNCNSTAVAGVTCTDGLGIRLVDGPERCAGRVEVRMGSVWGSVCGADWNVPKAEIVCELLECGHAVNISAVPRKGTAQVSSPTQTCYSSSESLKHCVHRGLPRATCAQNSDASVTCGDEIRLVDGPNPCSGRVEVLHKGQWGTVCDDDWGLEDARVVCRQLGCGAPVSAAPGANFGRGTGPVWLDNMGCTGRETALTQCPHNGWGSHNCGHEEDAGVNCLDIVQKPKLLMSPDTTVNWGDRLDITCAVVTQQARGTFTLRKTNDTFKMEKVSENDAVTFTFLKVNFSQGGFYYCEYWKNVSRDGIMYPQGEALQLTITVKLEKPSISMTSLEPVLIPSKDNISVSRGQSFNITCSVHSTYPGGFFYLTRPKVKVSEAKAAVNRSGQEVADFVFAGAEYSHKGEYSCVYGVNMSSHSFRSEPSRVIQVTVFASSSSVATAVVITLLLVVVLLVVGYVLWKKQKWRFVSDNMVRFVNRIGGVIQDFGNSKSAVPTATSAAPGSFTNEVYMDGIEDPPGAAYSDHEPLVITN